MKAENIRYTNQAVTREREKERKKGGREKLKFILNEGQTNKSMSPPIKRPKLLGRTTDAVVRVLRDDVLVPFRRSSVETEETLALTQQTIFQHGALWFRL